MHKDKLQQLANNSKELWIDGLKQLVSEVADIRKGNYSNEARVAVINIIDDFIKRINMASGEVTKDEEDWS